MRRFLYAGADLLPCRPQEAVLSTEASELAAKVHNRMPIILKPKDYERWLTRDEAERPPIDLLRPYDALEMKAWKVDLRVATLRNNEPGLCLEWE